MSAKQDFADLKFRIECYQITLNQATNSGLTLSGPGEIWQDDDGVLHYKIFTDGNGYQKLNAYMSRPGVVGQIIPDEELFNLEAKEHTLPIWEAKYIIPSPRGGLQEGLAYGFISELTQTQALPANAEKDYIKVRFKGKIDLPWNQGTQTITRRGGQDRSFSNSFNAASVEDGSYRFEAYHETNHTVISLVMPAGELTATTASRIHEALQFVLGKQLAVMVIETQAGGQQITSLISPSLDRGHGSMLPPLHFHRLDQGGNIWRMFCNYFRRVHSDISSGWHPISNHIGRVIESTSASLDTEILALGVAVEGLVGECFSDLSPVSADFLRELSALREALQSIQLTEPGPPAQNVILNPKTLARINGSIEAMRKPRNSDVLRAFIKRNNLHKDLYNSWSDLRNTSAHGDGAGNRNLEKILRLKHEVLFILYSIVFATINYTGPRTDYSLPGWPTRPWPITQPDTTPSASAPASNTAQQSTLLAKLQPSATEPKEKTE